jgi:hypothetical protein
MADGWWLMADWWTCRITAQVTVADCWLEMADGWWLRTDGWWLMTDGWWMMDDGWWMVDDGWWMMADGWWLMADDGWLMDDGWWMMTDGWRLMAFGWWLRAEDWVLMAFGWGQHLPHHSSLLHSLHRWVLGSPTGSAEGSPTVLARRERIPARHHRHVLHPFHVRTAASTAPAGGVLR